MTGRRLGILTRAGLGLALGALAVAVSTVQAPAGAQSFPMSTDVETYRDTVETVFMEDRGGTTSGYASCVMCHTWQTSIRFSLETPETDAGWTGEQSRRNLDVVGQLINTAAPESSRLLLKPLSGDAGGLPHTGGTFWTSTDDPEYGRLLQWIQRLPDDQFIPAPEPEIDFDFLPCVRPGGVRQSARGAAPLQPVPLGRAERLRAGAGTGRPVERRRGTAGLPADLPGDHAGQRRAEPVSAETAAPGRWRGLHAQRAAPVGEPQRPRVADARPLGAGGALRVQLFVSHDPRRCSSVAYCPYAPSSRLAERAPRRPRCLPS